MYSINDAAERCGISAYAIRFYDKEGLLPFIGRSNRGHRQFCESDLKMLELICCLKNTGMPIKEIKKYIDLYMEGDSTVPLRKQMMAEHSKAITVRINDLKKQQKTVKEKIAFYESYDGACACCHD